MSHQFKFHQKLTAALLALLVACAAVPSAMAFQGEESVSAAPSLVVEEETPQEESSASGTEIAESDPVEIGEGVGEINMADYFSASNANIDGSMYSRLNTRQRACYNALQNISVDRFINSPEHEVEVTIAGINGQTVQGTSFGGRFTPTGNGVNVYNSMQNDMQVALVALRYDRPDMIWLQGRAWTAMTFLVRGGVGTVNDVSYQVELEFGGEERSMREAMLSSAKAIARQAMQQPDTYLRVKAAHDILADQNEYEHTPNGSRGESLSHLAYSALIANDPYDPVCDGYSKAFKMVLDEMGIPCVCVSSATHMWNNVKMDDGLWYNVDLTWDDGSNILDWDYFLVGSQTSVAGQPFNTQESHIELDPFLEAELTLGGAKYPKKYTKAYIYLGEDYPPLRYADVPRDAWFYNQVENVSELGYFSGNNKGLFEPNGKFTRAQFASVMASVMGVDLSSYRNRYSFQDVKTNQWYAAAVAWAKEAGMMGGDNRNLFRPNASITKQEICLVLYKALGLESTEIGATFADDDKIAPWARYQVYACRDAGLISGDNQGKVNPTKGAVRSEAATIFSAYARVNNDQ